MSTVRPCVAVTGATGFLGAEVCLALRSRGARVFGVCRSPDRGGWLAEQGVTLRRADLADEDALAAAFDGADVVIANAALGGQERHRWEDYVATNVQGPARVVRAAARVGARVVQVSSAGVYRARARRVNGLDTPLVDGGFQWSGLVTNTAYALSKALGEAEARSAAGAAGVGLTTVRPGPIYGPRDPKMTVRYARWMRLPVLALPTMRLPHAHVGDIAAAIAAAALDPGTVGRIYNLTGPPVSPYEVARTWARLAGRGPVLIPIPVPLWVAFDDATARDELGFAPRSIEQGLRDVLSAGPPAI